VNTNVNLAAPVGVLALLGTAFLWLLLLLFLLYSLLRRRTHWFRVSFLAIIALAAAYLSVLFIFSLASREKILARGSEKHFCEIDCHLAYSVIDVRRTRTLGNGPDQVVAAGEFALITIRTRFDETTISPTRGNGPLSPNPRRATVSDAAGRVFPVSAEGERALTSMGQTGTPLLTTLRPGESYVTTLVFDLPADASNPTLLLQEDASITRFVIGHENSLFHHQTRFTLAGPQTGGTAAGGSVG
jgi:hypothetical protein